MLRSNRIPPGVAMVDLEVGTGAWVEAGCRVTVHTRGWLRRGDSIDHDPEHGDRVTFRIGARTVIAGLERGVIGMRVGGKRRLRISPHLAYGDEGIPERIPPRALLVYEVEVLACEAPTG